MRHPELLVPASSLEVLKIAVIFGADAVYIGGEAFGLRAKAKNFTNEEIKEGIAFAHEHGVKVYITANILAHNQDLEGVKKYFTELKEIKPDALIIFLFILLLLLFLFLWRLIILRFTAQCPFRLPFSHSAPPRLLKE